MERMRIFIKGEKPPSVGSGGIKVKDKYIDLNQGGGVRRKRALERLMGCLYN